MTVATEIDLQAWGVLNLYAMPLKLRPPAPLNDEELLAFSHRNELHQVERNSDGEWEITMSPGGQGSRWEAMVIAQLSQWTESHGGVCFSSSSGFTLPNRSMRAPDAAWITDMRWSSLTKAQQNGYVPLCPDFLVEILSQGDSPTMLGAKMQMWLENGAQLAWMIDPYRATVSIYTPNAAVEVLNRPEFVEAGTPVAGFRLSTRRLWAE